MRWTRQSRKFLPRKGVIDMNLNPYFKSVLDQDRASIVLCGLDHTILYMNPAAIRSYA